jgi:hypothetical protein
LGWPRHQIYLWYGRHLAEALPEEAWQPLGRLVRYAIAIEPRQNAPRVKEAIVRFEGYLNKKLVARVWLKFNYQPNQCEREYRLVVEGKNISTQKGEKVLFEDIKYLFYITNHSD